LLTRLEPTKLGHDAATLREPGSASYRPCRVQVQTYKISKTLGGLSMCGIAGIYLRDESLVPQLGSLMHEMVEGIVVRVHDYDRLSLYGDHDRLPEDYSSVSILYAPSDIKQLVAEKLPHSADVSF